MKQPEKFSTSLVNSMISSDYELFHVKDFVVQEKTLYHYHDFYEIHCTLEGFAEFYLDGQKYLLQPGSVIFIHSLDLHRIMKQNSDVFDRVYMFITPSFLKRSSSKYTDLEYCFHPIGATKSKVIQTEPEKLKEFFALMEAPANKKEYGADLMREQRVINLLIYLNRQFIRSEKEIQLNEPADNDLITGIMAYVSENLATTLSLEEVAKEFYVSKYYIPRVFKKSTGFTFHNYVLKKRLLYAKQLLAIHKNANQIYLQCGFKSYPHFLKCFKKEFSMTPKEYIKKLETQEVVLFEHHSS